MTKANRIWFDLETTGFESRTDQILEIAAIVDDPSGNEIDRVEIKVRLKHNITPGPGALMVNKINPYSKAWVSESVTEHDAIAQVAALAKKHTTADGVKPIMTAYFVDFDKDKTAVAFARNGFFWREHFNRSAFDPYKTARALVQSGVIKTKINTYAGGRTAPSAKQEDVAAALGILYKGEAHRAMADVEVMRDATKIMFKKATGYDLSGTSADPSKYQIGQVVKLITDSKSSGAKVRHLLVTDNDVENGRVVGIDEDDIKLNGGFTKTAVRKFNYGTIVGELEPDADPCKTLSNLLVSKAEEVAKMTKTAKAQLIKDDKEEFKFDQEVSNFELVEKIERNINKCKDKKAAHAAILKELSVRLEGGEEEAGVILEKAEQLSCAKGNDRWNVAPPGQEGVRLLTKQAPGVDLRIGLHPAGYYAVGLITDKNGKQARELKECKTKKDILTFLKTRVSHSDEVDSFVNSELPDVETFKNPKHPILIEAELKNAMDALTIKKVDDDIKAAISGLILQLQEQYPQTFAKYKTPIDPTSFNIREYWKKKSSGSGDDEGTSGSEGGSAGSTGSGNGGFAASSDSSEQSAQDHIRPGDKVSKTPCALCHRPLSAKISLEASMGPTCRKNAAVIEASEGPLDEYRDAYKPFSPGAAPRPGDLIALKIKEHGKESERLAEFIGITPTQTQIVDRRKLMKLLKTEMSPVFATYLSMTKTSHNSISGIAKLKAPRERDEEAQS
jgi:hypothetical protein